MAMMCPPSWTLRGPQFVSGEAADNGTKLHKVIAAYYTRRAPSAQLAYGLQSESSYQLEEMANDLGVLADWKAYRDLLPGEDMWGKDVDPMIEIPWAFDPDAKEHRIPRSIGDRDYSDVSETEFYGTADLIVEENDRVHVIDWKTGQGYVTPPKDNWQIRVAAVWARNYFNKPVVGHIFMLAKGTWDAHHFSDDELGLYRASLSDLKSRLLALSKTKASPSDFQVGDHCTFCPKFEICPSQMRLVRTAMGEPEIIRATDVSDAAMKVMLLKVAIRKAEDQLRMYVDRNGPVKLSDGSTYEARDSSVEAIDPGLASIVVKNRGLNPLDFADDVKYTKARIKRVLGTKKGKELIDELRDSGAIKKVARRTYRVYKKGEDEGETIDGSAENVKEAS